MSIAIRLPEELEKRLENLAKKTRRSKSFYVREALEHYLEDIEDYNEAMVILENPGRLYTLEEVIKRHGLGD